MLTQSFPPCKESLVVLVFVEWVCDPYLFHAQKRFWNFSKAVRSYCIFCVPCDALLPTYRTKESWDWVVIFWWLVNFLKPIPRTLHWHSFVCFGVKINYWFSLFHSFFFLGRVRSRQPFYYTILFIYFVNSPSHFASESFPRVWMALDRILLYI